jgi:hypothetical protein
MAGVETRFNSSSEIACCVVLVKVPVKKTTWLVLKVPPDPAIWEMFRPVMFTALPSAACECVIGTAKRPSPSPATIKADARRENPN